MVAQKQRSRKSDRPKLTDKLNTTFLAESKRSSFDLRERVEQPSESIRFVAIGPTNDQIEKAQKRIKNGESESRVIDELLREILDANARYWKQQSEGLTE